MPAAARRKAGSPASSDKWRHLWDELQRLDLRLRLQVLKQPLAQAPDALSPFKGLVVTDAEISNLLCSTQGLNQEPDAGTAEQLKLEQALANLQNEIEARRAASVQVGAHLSLPRLAELFSLTRFEEQCVVVCLAPEIDRKYDKVYAYLQDDTTRRKPSVGLALSVLCQGQSERLEARAAFNPNSALFKFKILQMTDGADGGPLVSCSLKLDDRIANGLLGQNEIDARVEPFARLILPCGSPPGMIAAYELYQQTKAFLKAFFSEQRSGLRSMSGNVALYLHGPANTDRQLIIESVCNDFGLALIVADVAQMKAGPLRFDEVVRLLVREARLQSAALCLENADCLIEEPEARLAEFSSALESAKTFLPLTFMTGSRRWHPQRLVQECRFLSVATPKPELGLCKRFWEQSLAANERVPIRTGPYWLHAAGGGESGSLAFSGELADHRRRSVGRLPRAIEPSAGRACSQN
jgi:hypothetical protein